MEKRLMRCILLLITFLLITNTAENAKQQEVLGASSNTYNNATVVNSNTINHQVKYTPESSKYISKNKISAEELELMRQAESQEQQELGGVVEIVSGAAVNVVGGGGLTGATNKDKADTTTENKRAVDKYLTTQTYIVDITNINTTTHELQGNTSTEKGYSGVIKIVAEDNSNISTNIQIGDTYVIKALPKIEVGDIPTITMVSCKKATDKQVEKLEKIREHVSNFDRLMQNKGILTMEELIKAANKSYSTWTQDQIHQYLQFINNSSSSVKTGVMSEVKDRSMIKQSANTSTIENSNNNN